MAPPLTTGWVYHMQTAPESSNAVKLVCVATIFSGLSCVALLLRFYCRWHLLKTKGADDAASALSFVVGTAYCANNILHTRWGLGLAVQDIPDENIIPFQKVQYVGGPLYPISVLGFKLSLLLVYLRLAGFNRAYKYILWAVITLVTINSVIFAFVFAWSCTPPEKTWNRELPGTCLDELSFYFAFAGTSIGFDALVIALPFPILRHLNLNVRKKIGLCVLFGLGIFVTIIQIIRIQTLANLKVYTQSQTPILWSMIEIHVGVLAACIPTYTPLLRIARNKISTAHSSSQDKSSGYDKGATDTVEMSMLNNGGKGKMLSSRNDAMMDDEIALCDAPHRVAKSWVVPRELAMAPIAQGQNTIP